MTALLSVTQLRFSYRRGGDELFEGLNYNFEPAAMTALSGPSGRGKSTLLYLLGLLLRPTAGEVVLDGAAVQSLPDVRRSALRAARIGFVFQDAVLDPTRSVVDAVVEPALYAGVRRDEALTRAERLMAEFGLQARAAHRPGEISGGQAQRVALCRALVNDPAVILADEPTGNLDRANAVLVLDALRDAATAGRTVVIATHDAFVIDRVDHVLPLP